MHHMMDKNGEKTGQDLEAIGQIWPKSVFTCLYSEAEIRESQGYAAGSASVDQKT